MKGENRVLDRLENVELLLAWVIPGLGLVLGIEDDKVKVFGATIF